MNSIKSWLCTICDKPTSLPIEHAYIYHSEIYLTEKKIDELFIKVRVNPISFDVIKFGKW